MNKRNLCLLISALVIAAGLAPSPVAAETMIVQEVHTGGVMGQPATDSTNTLWIADDRMRMNSEDNSMIVRLDEKKIYIINHAKKTFSTIEYPVDLNSMMPPEMAQMMGQMNFKATVTPSDETKDILGHTARRYDVVMKNSMMEMKQTVWATKDVKFDYSSAREMVDALQSLQPGMTDAFKEMTKIEGFQLEMDGAMSVMGNDIEMQSKTISIEKSGAPDGGYAPPEGYTGKPFNPMNNRQ